MKRIQFLEDEGKIVFDGQAVIHLDYQLSKLFGKLLRNENQLIAKEELIKSVWTDNEWVGREALPKAIWRLRKAIKEAQLQDTLVIETKPKRGYCLTIKTDKPMAGPQQQPSIPLYKRPAFVVGVLFVIIFTIMGLCSIGEEVIYLTDEQFQELYQ